MYALVEQKLMAGENIILDGGTGTEIQRRGVPMHHQVWCAEANVTHPDVVRAVHCDYLRAGAEVITANTFATSPLLFNAVKRDRDIREFDRIAVRLVREAVEEAAVGAPVAIAGSFSTMRPVAARSDRPIKTKEWTLRQAEPLMHAKAEALAEAGCDLILMERCATSIIRSGQPKRQWPPACRCGSACRWSGATTTGLPASIVPNG
jgi:S-methylmethionine-dependent homocysteine/selenocysteine methylase